MKHPLFALLVRHREWILNHLVRNDFLLSWTTRVTLEILLRDQLHFSIVSWSVNAMVTQQPRFQTAWFLGLIAGSDEVIALHPGGVQRHHGEWRVIPLDDLESNLRELKSSLALMTDVDWRTPGCKTCQDVRYHRGWHSVECREREFFLRRYQTRCGLSRQRNDFWTLVR